MSGCIGIPTMHGPSDDDEESPPEPHVEAEWERFREHARTMVNDATIVICALMLMEELLPKSGYPPNVQRRLRERITHLRQLYQSKTGEKQ